MRDVHFIFFVALHPSNEVQRKKEEKNKSENYGLNRKSARGDTCVGKGVFFFFFVSRRAGGTLLLREVNFFFFEKNRREVQETALRKKRGKKKMALKETGLQC